MGPRQSSRLTVHGEAIRTGEAGRELTSEKNQAGWFFDDPTVIPLYRPALPPRKTAHRFRPLPAPNHSGCYGEPGCASGIQVL
jgi:hypothetical protein